MKLTQLQEHVVDMAGLILDSSVGICLDKFKRGGALESDAKILEIGGLNAAVNVIVDDSLYWAGCFSVTSI